MRLTRRLASTLSFTINMQDIKAQQLFKRIFWGGFAVTAVVELALVLAVLPHRQSIAALITGAAVGYSVIGIYIYIVRLSAKRFLDRG